MLFGCKDALVLESFISDKEQITQLNWAQGQLDSGCNVMVSDILQFIF